MKPFRRPRLNREQLDYVRWYVSLAETIGYRHAFNCFYHSFSESPLFGDTSFYSAMRYFSVATNHID